MTPFNIELTRHKIAHSFAQWTALSALRSGSPLKSRDDVYPFLSLTNFAVVLDSDQPITKREFNDWHKLTLTYITSDQRLNFGWAAKIVNVYLKSICYLSGIGRPDLIRHIHPPIHGGLWAGLKRVYAANPEIWEKVYSRTKIKDIDTYEQYLYVIDGIELISDRERCLLIEVEKYWEGTSFKKKKNGS